ncbi:MAG: hypothetical protein Kilf2KO_15480 [Rhodospirillales bacterium]
MIWLEAMSYIVTILGFPAAIAVLIHEERKRRTNEERELHRSLSVEYDSFLRMAMDNADLLLFSQTSLPEQPTKEQQERTEIIFRMLVSLFEKAYIILHSEGLNEEATRLWQSWEDDMSEWCRREDFRKALPGLLEGEDDQFSRYITQLAESRPAKIA